MARATLGMLVCAITFAGATTATRPALAQASQAGTAQDPFPETTHLRAPRFGGQAGVPQDPFPETTGKAALVKVCSNCHAAEMVIQSLRTRQEWSDAIEQMAQFGAEGSDQEFDQILNYLVRHFSPIKVNKATAKELETTLDLPANVAEAIVAYRGTNGDFKSLDDLKKVPGLEANRVEAQKVRIVF